MKFYSPSAEERAFLFQEAQDLEPLMKDLGSLSVTVEETLPSMRRNKKKTRSQAKPNYRVTFVVAPESVGMKVQATNSNLFDATIAAKEETLRQLNAIVNSLPRDPNAPMNIPPEFLH
jgi:hypothetical protein